VHARQVCEPTSQTGVPPEQSAFVVQPTQTQAAAKQTGVVPVHAVAFVGEH
jgi:hypothetical protein